MGCDIHSFVEIMGENGVWREVTEPIFDDRWFLDPDNGKFSAEPFSDRNYRIFGFLAGVRDRSVPCVTGGTRGTPDDVSNDRYPRWPEDDYHSQNWVLASELLEYDYDTVFKTRQEIVCRLDEGGVRRADPEFMTVGDYLGSGFLDRVAQIAGLHEDPRQVRVVMAFDS